MFVTAQSLLNFNLWNFFCLAHLLHCLLLDMVKMVTTTLLHTNNRMCDSDMHGSLKVVNQNKPINLFKTILSDGSLNYTEHSK